MEVEVVGTLSVAGANSLGLAYIRGTINKNILPFQMHLGLNLCQVLQREMLPPSMLEVEQTCNGSHTIWGGAYCLARHLTPACMFQNPATSL